MSDFRLVELDSDNLLAAVAIPPQMGEKAYVAPVVFSIAEAYVTPTAWRRVVLDGDEMVGFVIANWDPDNEVEEFRGGIWRLNVSAAKGRGVGRFAVKQVREQARRRG